MRTKLLKKFRQRIYKVVRSESKITFYYISKEGDRRIFDLHKEDYRSYSYYSPSLFEVLELMFGTDYVRALLKTRSKGRRKRNLKLIENGSH